MEFQIGDSLKLFYIILILKGDEYSERPLQEDMHERQLGLSLHVVQARNAEPDRSEGIGHQLQVPSGLCRRCTRTAEPSNICDGDGPRCACDSRSGCEHENVENTYAKSGQAQGKEDQGSVSTTPNPDSSIEADHDEDAQRELHERSEYDAVRLIDENARDREHSIVEDLIFLRTLGSLPSLLLLICARAPVKAWACVEETVHSTEVQERDHAEVVYNHVTAAKVDKVECHMEPRIPAVGAPGINKLKSTQRRGEDAYREL